jgi:hypothetical protein
MLREGYMGGLSETFSKASHEGQYDLALESGETLLSLYLLIYPLNYPQIGKIRAQFKSALPVLTFRALVIQGSTF